MFWVLCFTRHMGSQLPLTGNQTQTPCSGGKILTMGLLGKSLKLYKFVCKGVRVRLIVHIFLYWHTDTEEEEETLPNSFHETSVTRIPKSDKDLLIKSTTVMDWIFVCLRNSYVEILTASYEILTGKFGLGVQNEAGQRPTELAKRTHWSWQIFFSNSTREDSTHGHHQMVNTETRLIIFFAAKDGEALYSQQKQDQEWPVAQIMNSLLPN